MKIECGNVMKLNREANVDDLFIYFLFLMKGGRVFFSRLAYKAIGSFPSLSAGC